jgi:trehalose-phosphatase
VTGLSPRLTLFPRLILLDVDGTLAPIVPRPELAVVPEETLAIIAALAATPGVTVGLVTGRSAADARRMVGVDGLWVIGNHGLELQRPDGGVEIELAAADYADVMARVADRLAPVVAAVPGARLENKIWTLSVHYRQVAAGSVADFRSAVGNIVADEGLTVRDGKQVIEVRPPVPVDKGTAVVGLVRRLSGRAGLAGASVLFAGDDVTDEDAFRALRAQVPGAVTVRVGDAEDGRVSAAEYRVDDPAALRELLAEMV